jgi:hypothetical protein
MNTRIFAAVTALSLLSGCASQLNRDMLTSLNQRCTEGDATACREAIHQESVNRDEARANALKVAAVAVLLPIVVLAAAAGARAEENARPVCYSPWRRVYYRC